MRILITVVCCFIGIAASAQKFNHADKYIEYINKQQENVVKQFLKYNKSISYSSKKNTAKKVQNKYDKLIAVLNEAQKNIDSLPVFQKDSTHKDSVYKDSARSYFKQYGLLLSNAYNRVASLQLQATQSYSNMEAYLQAKDAADKKLKRLNERFYAVTIKFEHNHNITDSTRQDIISKKTEEIIETGAYFKQVYLLFFKCFKQEADIQNTIQRKDANGLKKKTKELAKYAEDGQNVLDTLAAFKNDKSLITDCKAILVFYDKEADDKLDPVTDYFSAAKDFDDVRLKFNKKQGHSGPEVKEYKKSVKIFNKALKKYNKAMNDIYKKKKSLLQKWDSSTHTFIHKFMPAL